MPEGIYSIGKDVTLTIVVPEGPPLSVKITSFKSKQDDSIQRIVPINGDSDNLQFIHGWSGSFVVERTGPVLDQYFRLKEQNYFNGVNEGRVAIREIIREPDGSISQFLYTKVKLSYSDAGDYTGEKSVQQNFNFVASRRK